MTEAVLDASVVLKWFRSEGERNLAGARSLRSAFEAGDLVVLAPTLLALELINVAGRRWRWAGDQLAELATALGELGFELQDPELPRVAHWTAQGLTAYDAAYIAVAEAEAVPFVTDDDRIVACAPHIATALADVPPATTAR